MCGSAFRHSVAIPEGLSINTEIVADLNALHPWFE